MILSVACIVSLAFIHGISAACNNVRLAGSELANEGRLEVECNGNWGTVCDDKFDSRAAGVACSMLGFEGGEVLDNLYGPGNGEILLDDVRCQGDEATLGACQHGAVGVSNCEHMEDVSISCTIPVTPTEAPTDGGGGGGGAGDSDGTDAALSGCWQLSAFYGRSFFTAGHREGARGWVWQIRTPYCPCGEKVYKMFNASNWMSGEPSDVNTHCMSLFRGRDYSWGDYYCYIESCSICEIDLY